MPPFSLLPRYATSGYAMVVTADFTCLMLFRQADDTDAAMATLCCHDAADMSVHAAASQRCRCLRAITPLFSCYAASAYSADELLIA